MTATSDRPMMPVTAAATFCATLVDEWIRAGVSAAFIAPGSRSTPLALALAERPEIDLHLFHDERSAGFAALGFGLATARPAVALCSSGTAGTHFQAAVVEADHSTVPLIVVTADRPPELWHIGAQQTIDQTKLFGSSVRWFGEPGTPEAGQASGWRSFAARTVAEAAGWSGHPGPVHLNLSFRDPLAGRPDTLPAGRPDGSPWHQTPSNATGSAAEESAAMLLDQLRHRRGIIIAGGGTSDPAAVVTLAEALQWPLLADHRSGCRGSVAINHFDALLRHPSFAAERRPDVIVRFGQPLASKVLSQWLAACDADIISAVPTRRWLDPERAAHRIVPEAGLAVAWLARITEEDSTLDGATAGSEAAIWQAADARAADAIASTLAAEVQPTEPGVCRAVIAGAAPSSTLVVSSSMPIRDVEWLAGPRDDITVVANRGANGIDGVISTAIGVAASGRPTLCLIGDVATLHDSTSLIGLARRPIDLTIVIIDNDGGGIFSFLPQRDLVAADRFERLFGTPHGTDLFALARAHGLDVAVWSGSLPDPSGVSVVIAATDRATNVALHARCNQAVADAIDQRP